MEARQGLEVTGLLSVVSVERVESRVAVQGVMAGAPRLAETASQWEAKVVKPAKQIGEAVGAEALLRFLASQTNSFPTVDGFGMSVAEATGLHRCKLTKSSGIRNGNS